MMRNHHTTGTHVQQPATFMVELSYSIELLAILFATGLVAGAIDAIAGGGGLLALPVLLATGITPTEALATNKLQGSFGTFSSSLFFIRKGLINLRQIWFLILCTFVGAMSGTLLVQAISVDFLSSLIPILLILVALYFWFAPTPGTDDTKQHIGYPMFALSVGFAVGFYDGFFGPGAGSFFTIGFVTLLGFNLLKATAHTKILNFTSNISSLIFFIIGGHVIWQLGIVMAVGQFIGGRVGAHLVFMRGSKLIRPMIIIISLLISLKLLLSEFEII